MRQRARVDANHGEIRDALRRCGWYVYDSHHVGGGFFDLIAVSKSKVDCYICCAHRTVFIEIKDGSKIPSARRLTPDEARIHAEFLHAGAEVVVIETVKQALAL